MAKPAKRMLYFVVPALVAIVIVLNNSCTFRVSDAEARERFNAAGVKAKIQTGQFGRYKIHYIQTGNDTLPTLLFVHGSPGSSRDYSGFGADPELTQKFRILLVDRPGFGHSNFGRALPLKEQTELLWKWLESLNNTKPVFLIGHSLGGPLVAWLAADHPEAFSAIIIQAGALDPDLEPKEYWRYVMKIFPLNYFLPGAFRPSNKELVYLKKDLKVLAKKLDRITCDVYIMHGDKDMFVDIGNVDFMKQRFVNARSVSDTVFNNENHFLPWTRVKELKTLLMALPEE